MKHALKVVVSILVASVVVYFLYRADYAFWRAEHPDAAEWTYWLSSHH